MAFCEIHNVESVEIRSKKQCIPAARNVYKIAKNYGLRVIPWHNLGSATPMTTPDGELLCSTVFGWGKNEEWWHGTMMHKMLCPLTDHCRYQSGPFWGHANAEMKSRYPSPYLEKIDLTWMWANTSIRSVLVVPVHMQLGQIGFMGFVSDRLDFDFEEYVDHLTLISYTFLSSYDRVFAPPRTVWQCEPLEAREIDCLRWAFDGKTDRDIAEITGRSYAAVRFYISRAADKLNTVNRAQTLAKAATLGYFPQRI